MTSATFGISTDTVVEDLRNAAFSLPYLSDWNAEVCRNTDDAVQLFRSAADYLTRTEK
jgi:hypothetical protein